MQLSKKQFKEFSNDMSSQATLNDALIKLNEVNKVMATSLNCHIGFLKSVDHASNIALYKDYLIDIIIRVPVDTSNLHTLFKIGDLNKSDALKAISLDIKVLTHYRDVFLSKKNYLIPDYMNKYFLGFIRDYYSISKRYLPKEKQNKVTSIYKLLKIAFKFI